MGEKSASSRKRKLGVKGFREYMKALRQKRTDKELSLQKTNSVA